MGCIVFKYYGFTMNKRVLLNEDIHAGQLSKTRLEKCRGYLNDNYRLCINNIERNIVVSSNLLFEITHEFFEC